MGSSSLQSSAASVWTALSRMQMEHILGVSAVAGTSLFVVKVVLYALRSSSLGKEEEADDYSEPSLSRSVSLSLLGVVRRFLSMLLLVKKHDTQDGATTENDVVLLGDGKPISHQGSCHCESIQFQVLAPRRLIAREGPGKIQYKHTQIDAANFRVVAGHECLKTYYVFRNNARKGAHAFCERCGVHILYAPSKRTPRLNINVNCFEGNGISKIKVESKKDNISEGFAADGQWDTSDHLSTISEVTQPFHFQVRHMHSDSNDWKTYQRGFSLSSDLRSVGEHDNDAGDDEGDSGSIPIKKVSVPPPITPSTIDSSYRSHLPQLKLMPNRGGGGGSGSSLVDDLTNDDMSLSDEASLSSAHQKAFGSSGLRRTPNSRPPRYTTGTFSPTASPEMRNKMRYFMGKYKHQQEYKPNHDSAASSSTATTAASSMTNNFN